MEQNKIAGRPGIEPQRYHNQIQQWLNEGIGINGITATMLQKAIGGQYKKAVTILDEFKAGYETKELAELPEPPEALSNAINAAALDIWRLLWNQKNDEVNAARVEFEHEKAGLRELAGERLELIDQLEEQLEHVRQSEKVTSGQLTQANKQNNEQAQELASLRERLEARDQQVGELKHQLTESQQSAQQADKQHTSAMADVRRELESKTTKLDTAREQVSSLTAQLESRDHQVAELTDQLTDSKALTESLNGALSEQQAKFTDDIESERSKVAQRDQSVAVLESQLANAKESMAETAKRADKLQDELLNIAKQEQANKVASKGGKNE